MIKYTFSRTILFFSLLFAITQSLYAQEYDAILNELDTKYPQEKIYLHFDRSYYNPGETIWFKAYLTCRNLPSTISKTVYAELLDAKGTVLQRKIMPVVSAGAAANFDLPDSIRSPLLYVRAFTSWMLNFDSSLLYIKPLYIIGNSAVAKKAPPPASYSLHFFPEGGDLVAGIDSRVAFKANDQDGNPVPVSGNITDSKGKKITSFSAVHDGMGYFLFTPLDGEKYKASWKDKKGMLHETALPEAKKQGVVLNTITEDNNIIYTLTRPDSVDASFASFTVVVQMQQQLLYSASVNMSKKNKVSAPILTDSFPDGILQFTVFNAARIPVAERILFINHNNYFFITDLHAIEKNLSKRGHNTLQVDVGGSLLSNLSVSVTDENINPAEGDKTGNIFSQLLLTSDLKGYVYNPAYYFSGDEDSIKQHLDLVMMTNGWRRFKWENLLAGQWPQITQLPENALSVTGKVYGLSPGLLTGKEINCLIKTKNNVSELLTAPVSKDGQFNLKNMYFFDTARLYYQLNNDKDKKLTSTASFIFNNTFPRVAPPSTNLLGSVYSTMPDTSIIRKNQVAYNLLREQFFEGNTIKSLEAVTIKSRQKTAKEKLEEEYTSGFFTGGDAITFSTDDDPYAKSAYSVLNYLQGKVAGLEVNTIGDGSLSWRGSAPSIFLNEMNSDLSAVQSIAMSDVAMIKVFRPPFFGGISGGEGGAIAIYTKKGAANNALVKGLDFTNINGYSAIKEFYSPDYERNQAPGLNDYRTTLYWDPFLIIDKNKRRIKIPFYNSDNCKKIRVVIEGINEAGQLTREEKVFE